MRKITHRINSAFASTLIRTAGIAASVLCVIWLLEAIEQLLRWISFPYPVFGTLGVALFLYVVISITASILSQAKETSDD